MVSSNSPDREPFALLRVIRHVPRNEPGLVTDAAVIRSSLTEPRAFTLVFERHFPAIHGYAARRLGPELAQEIAAQAGSLTLPRVHEALAEAIKTWLELTKPQRGDIGGAVSDLLGPSDPATLGRTIAHTLYRARPVERQGFWAASGRRLKQGIKPEDKS